MKDETRKWLTFAADNLSSARILLESSLYNPCLQNIQQSVEKNLKALLVEKAAILRKTHSINELVTILNGMDLSVSLSAADCDLLDTIYLPSKYPLGSALPDFFPDEELCRRCLTIAETVSAKTKELL
ncbi:MAG: DNA-binding protein [Deltaproteobacteria bacterium RIFOXYD12_FULL_57_12]|nr:MAG: DNA-binding protein [Deltaproteobacteria bacterium RIFOXYD12_FULL_57_12]